MMTNPKINQERMAKWYQNRLVPVGSPWLCKQLPSGKWVIDQFSNGKIRRFGEYEKEEDAREVLKELRKGEK